MGKGYFFGAPVVTVVWIVAVTALISGAVVAVLHRRGVDRAVIVERLEVVWLFAALGGVAILTLQPGRGGLGSPLPPTRNPLWHASLSDVVANVVLYLPVGFFATLVWRKRVRRVALATCLAFIVSFSIEFTQWVLPISRSAQSRDVILNTLGGFLGAVAGTLVVRHSTKSNTATSDDTTDLD